MSVEQEPKESVPSSIGQDGMQSSSFGDGARSIQRSSTGDGVGESDQSSINGTKAVEGTDDGNWLVHLGADKMDFLFLKLQ